MTQALHAEPILVHYLIASACEGEAYPTIELITPALSLPPDSPARTEARSLIAELLDERPLRAGLVMALIGERSTMYGMCEGVKSGKAIGMPGIGSGFALIPDGIVGGDQVRILKDMTEYIDAARQPSYPAATAAFPPAARSEEQTLIERLTHALSNMMMPSLEGVFIMHFREIASRRMAAVALAMRMYELDHGRRPQKLQQLVPDYLPAVPDDPFAETPRPIGYRPDADPPVLYSIGEDGKDDNGASASPEKGKAGWRDRPDIVFFLNGDRPVGECQWEEPEDEGDLHSRDDVFFFNGDRPRRKFKQVEPEDEEEQPTSAPVNPSD